VLIGEIGLSGELRAVSQTTARLREAAALGFRRAIVPRTVRTGDPPPKDIELVPCRTLREAIEKSLVAG
jgi:DNA repair protein RadA/Sms